MSYPTPTFQNKGSFTQYGSVTGALGASGNVVVTLPVGYTTATSYNVQVTHSDATAGLRLSVVRTSASSFTIYWTSGGATTQPFLWFVIGS
jgi:hypothetical protein